MSITKPDMFRVDPHPQGGTCTRIKSRSIGGTQQTFYRIEPPVKWTRDLSKSQHEGELETDCLIVSLGREGDTAVFPGDWEHGIVDLLGYGSTFTNQGVDPDYMLELCGFTVKDEKRV